jgi:AcrR family transcriptional regulator
MQIPDQTTENSEKIEQIIKAAQKRFGNFGMHKTTMKEIATDIGISKALLYYYFPDKVHLYKTVVEKEHNQFIEIMASRFQKMENPAEMLSEYVTIRVQYFRSLLNLSRFRMEDLSGMKSLMESVWKVFYDKEIEIISNILEKGKIQQVLNFEDANETAQLFIDLLKGLSQMMIKKKQIFFLEQSEYDILLRKALLFTSIFIKGLKCNELTNNSLQ